MKAKLHLVFSISVFFGCYCIYGQQGYWRSIPKQSNLKSASLKDMGNAKAVFSLDKAVFLEDMESFPTSKAKKKIVYLPDSDGNIIPFNLEETPVLHPDLAKKYPNIKSYSGVSFDGKYKVKLSSSHKGLESMVVNLYNQKRAFMEPVTNKANAYVLYEKGAGISARDDFVCETEKNLLATSKTITPLVDDRLLRKFRIAVSATGEYTVEHGGAVGDALAAINTTITRINGVYETDLGVTLELVADNDLIIFTDPDTDPYGDSLNAEVQATITSVIGEENYDVGHLFHKVPVGQDNGNAGFIGAVCGDNRKGSAYSASSTPQGDVFELYLVAHELGHQFGANHTWSFASEGTGVQAEPASGTTIMSYAGIVGEDNVAPNGDGYFHFYSILQISEYLETVSCAQIISLTNSPPVLTPVGDYIIPKGTAFVLEGSATDSDIGDVLTYTWEQIDDGLVTSRTFGPTNSRGANFRSLPPNIDPARYFPKLSEVVLGNLTQTNPTEGDAWETVSEIGRNLSFACTVRDNALGGGQVVSDVLDVQVVKTAGPFVVTSQASNEVYEAGSIQEIKWEVANTNILPIDTKTVDIFLSLDGGASFPITLADDTLNDGSEVVLLPGTTTSSARIMVKASDNVFFAVNASDFTIVESPMVLNFESLSYKVCQPDNLVMPFIYEAYSGFGETATFSVDVPVGLFATFSPTEASADDTMVDLMISNTTAMAPGVYDITITATSASTTKSIVLSVTVHDGNFSDVVLMSPTNAQNGVSLDTQLHWEENPLHTRYDIQIATDADFANIIESATVPFNFYKISGLQQETEYFWRVRPGNDCGSGTYGTPNSFTTSQEDCKKMEDEDLPLNISSTGTPTVTASILFLEDLPVSDVNLNLELEHTYLEDLIITLISPEGTRVTLISNTCGDSNNINTMFDDDGDPIICSGNPAISGTVRPLDTLASLKGESIFGEWILEIQDTAADDGGTLIAFSLDVCVEGNYRPDDDEDGFFDDGDDLCLGTPKGAEVDGNGCAIYSFASDNFEIEGHGETCRNSDDGFITIAPLDTTIIYTAVLEDNEGTPISVEFNNAYTFENLSAGEYRLCITGTKGMNTYKETCFDAVITQPGVLEVGVMIDSGVLDLDLRGATFYNVELNGLITRTETNKILLPLKEGLNTLRVYSNVPCQGIVEKTLFYFSNPILFPNPVESNTEVYLNGYEGSVEIQVFSANGRLILTDVKMVKGNNLELDLSTLSNGIYYMSIEKNGKREMFKFIKR